MSRIVPATLVATNPAMVHMDPDPPNLNLQAQPTGYTAASVPTRVQVRVRRSGLPPVILGPL